MLIVGGGVIGCACAYYLARQGLSVRLVERGKVGHGCSYGNAGWMAPAHALPLPMPGALWECLGWLTRKDSPLYIKPRPAILPWLLSFLRHANRLHLEYATPALVEMATLSLALLEEVSEAYPDNQMDLVRNDLLYPCISAHGLKKARAELQLLREHGAAGRELTGEELRDLEPAITNRVIGGVAVHGQGRVEPLSVVETLASAAKLEGAEIHEDTDVRSVDFSGRRVTGLQTAAGRLEAETYVWATGSWTPELMRSLAIRVPIEAGKGYALILPPNTPPIRNSLLLIEKKIAVTPRRASLRLAGTMELAGLNDHVNPVRVDAILRGSRHYLDIPAAPEIRETWSGSRPCTPDGLPMIGRTAKFDNLLLAAGHAMLGLALSTGTGKLVSELITGKTPFLDPKPFDPARFQ